MISAISEFQASAGIAGSALLVLGFLLFALSGRVKDAAKTQRIGEVLMLISPVVITLPIIGANLTSVAATVAVLTVLLLLILLAPIGKLFEKEPPNREANGDSGDEHGDGAEPILIAESDNHEPNVGTGTAPRDAFLAALAAGLVAWLAGGGLRRR